MRPIHRYLTIANVIWLALLISWPNMVFSASVPEVVSLGRIDQDLSVPVAMDVDAEGNLWVADSRELQVLKFDQHGQQQAIFTTVAASGAGLAVEPDGSKVYVTTQNEIAVLDGQTGALLSSINPAALQETTTIPGEIDLDAAGYLFAVSQMEMQIVVFRPDGVEETRFGGIGTGEGQFRSIDGITLDHAGQRLYVADSNSQNYRVQVFDLQGNYLDSLSYSDDFGTTPLLTPKGMVGDDQGRLYFLEFMRSTVRVLDESTLLYLSVFGEEGIEVGQISTVRDLAFDPLTSRLFVSCDDGRIEMFGIDGGVNPPPGNHYPPVPVVSTPVAGSEVETMPFNLVWDNVQDLDNDAISYTVRIRDGDSVVWEQTAIDPVPGETSSVAVTTELNENATYLWEVLASDHSLSSDWSVAGEFSINLISEAPPVPILLTPVSGSLTEGQSTLSWDEAIDPDPGDQVDYRIEISSDNQFSELVLQTDLSSITVQLGMLSDYLLLDDGRQYWWRVVATDQHGVSSAPSSPFSFTYDTTLLTVKSNMPGSRVYLGGHSAYHGRYLGETPLSLRDMSVGDYSLIVVRSGCEPSLQQVSITERGNCSLNVALSPAIDTATYLVDPRSQTFSELGTSSAGAVPVLFDYDHDEFIDLLTGEDSGAVTLYRGLRFDRKGRAAYINQIQLPVSIASASRPFPVDWNNDNKMDLLIGSADGTIQLVPSLETVIASGQAQMTPVMVAGSVLQVTSPAVPAVADLDDDHDKDLLVGDGDGKVWLARNVGTDDEPLFGQLELLTTVSGAARPMSVDWDADGVIELLIANDDGLKVMDIVSPIEQPLTITVQDKKEHALTGIHAVFPLDVDLEDGKELLVGLNDGSIRLVESRDDTWRASCWTAVDDKLAELSLLLTDAAEPIQTELADLALAIGSRDRQSSFSLSRTLSEDLEVATPECVCAEQLADFIK
jgi:DNA-binding beta-propeller fold protein YncE